MEGDNEVTGGNHKLGASQMEGKKSSDEHMEYILSFMLLIISDGPRRLFMDSIY